MSVTTGIQFIKGVGPQRAEQFGRLGVATVEDLVRLYPRAYADWSAPLTVSQAPLGEPCCIKARLLAPFAEHRVRKGLTLYKANADDGKSGLLQITLFNNRYLAQKPQAGEEYLFYGRTAGNLLRKEMASPEIEPASFAKIRPIYRQTEGLSSRVIEGAVQKAFALTQDLRDPLPQTVLEAYGLMPLEQALRQIHFPDSMETMEAARRRLVFEELFLLQAGLSQLKARSRGETSCLFSQDTTRDFAARLPFSLTGAQRRVIAECAADLQKGRPMNRLVQGDVGSGKTAVAAALCHMAAANGFQAAMMAPTEILAEQHYRSLSGLLKGTGVTVGLLTGSAAKAEKERVKAALLAGDIQLLVGTHALLQETVAFRRLGLVVTDEQHRFGVGQRAALAAKGDNPHMLVMSATPIPRTLALIIYGDLDVSVIDELPPGRQPVETYAVSTKLRQRAYGYIQKHLDEGRQGYVVCPLVEEGETELIPAAQYAEKLQKGPFRDYRVGLLHGRMKPAEKEAVMRRFSHGEIQLLVSTTVVEVGVDVPNAVIMVVENAERFGLSQLHQLRGRIGRGEHQSTCILISDARNPEALRRLKVMRDTADGFQIADEDLRLRGPGDFFGSRQHGLPDLKIADMMEDMEVLRQTQRAVRPILEADPSLLNPAHAPLKAAVERLFGESIASMN
ncbi:MAG: ATP-dependent DNA helicase RecG [Clostridiales bacterium]|nr:ATP-dependent DNA helicase RecG [Clostridiales bacterium]